MRVLHLSFANAAGVPQAWARAHREIGVDAWHLAEIPNDFGYPADQTLRWSVGEPTRDLDEILDRYTHIVVHDVPSYCPRIAATGKPWAYRALGTSSWNAVTRLAHLDVPKFCETPDFIPHGFTWLPAPLWERDYPPRDPLDRFTVCHAPSNRLVKGTDAVIAACKEIGCDLDLIENTDHRVCLHRKARCHVLVDSVAPNGAANERACGFGRNGLEAMMLGIPVVGEESILCANARPYQRPFMQANAETLPIALDMLRQDAQTRARVAREGRKHVRRYHDPGEQGRRSLEVLVEC